MSEPTDVLVDYAVRYVDEETGKPRQRRFRTATLKDEFLKKTPSAYAWSHTRTEFFRVAQ